MQEIWKDIPNYEGIYQVSNLGNVKSLDKIVNSAIKNNSKVKRTGKILKQHNKNGYMQVTLIHNNKRKYYNVHRLVALTFIPNPENKPQVNHKDENKLNNCVDNLEWCTAKYNCNYGKRNSKIYNSTSFKRVKIELYDLQGNFIASFKSMIEASKFYGCNISTIYKYCNNSLKSKDYIWRYADK